MTLIVILNAVLALLVVGVIVTLHSHAILTEHRLGRRPRHLRTVPAASASQTRDYWRERQAA